MRVQKKKWLGIFVGVASVTRETTSPEQATACVNDLKATAAKTFMTPQQYANHGKRAYRYVTTRNPKWHSPSPKWQKT